MITNSVTFLLVEDDFTTDVLGIVSCKIKTNQDTLGPRIEAKERLSFERIKIWV